MIHFGRLIKKASNQLTRDFDAFAKPYGLTGTQMSVIDFIYRGEKETYFQRDIEQEFHIQRSTATGILQGMEKKGLLERRISPDDARQRSVHLTDKAMGIAQLGSDYFSQEEARLQEHFSIEEYQHFTAILNFIVQGGPHDKH